MELSRLDRTLRGDRRARLALRSAGGRSGADPSIHGEGLLHQEDRASMAVSIESRVPFLDHRIIEFLGTVPPEQKVADRVPKALLRRVAAPMLPDAIVQRRDKGAFGVPTDHWFAGELKALVESIVYSPLARERGIFDQVELKSGVHGTARLWCALSVELWHRIHIDQDREWLDRVAPAAAQRTTPVHDRYRRSRLISPPPRRAARAGSPAADRPRRSAPS